MNRKLLLLGGAAAVGLVLLSGKKAGASVPPALPGPMLQAVPKPAARPKAAATPIVTAPGKVELVAPIDEQAAANAAAAASASAMSPGLTTPASAPAASSLYSTSSTSAPSPSSQNPSIPAGYDPVTARKAAKATANHLARKGTAGYSRPLLRQWQTQAGLKPDGIYGGATRGALLFYGVQDPPRAFFAPTNTVTFRPPA